MARYASSSYSDYDTRYGGDVDYDYDDDYDYDYDEDYGSLDAGSADRYGADSRYGSTRYSSGRYGVGGSDNDFDEYDSDNTRSRRYGRNWRGHDQRRYSMSDYGPSAPRYGRGSSRDNDMYDDDSGSTGYGNRRYSRYAGGTSGTYGMGGYDQPDYGYRNSSSAGRYAREQGSRYGRDYGYENDNEPYGQYESDIMPRRRSVGWR